MNPIIEQQQDKKPSLFLSGEVNEDMLMKVIPFLYNNRRRPVQIFIASLGGSVSCGLEIANFIEQHKKVTVIASGNCCSMAVNILLAANKRLATKHTEFMIHFGNIHASSKLEYDRQKAQADIIEAEYKKKLNLDEDYMLVFMNTEMTLDFEEAKKLGLIEAEYTL